MKNTQKMRFVQFEQERIFREERIYMDGGSMRAIRKRFDPALSNIKNIYGCYVTAAGTIVTTMEIPVQDMDQEEREMYSKLLKSTVSGPDGRHLHDIAFSEEKMDYSDEYRLLKALADRRLEEESMRSLLYDRIIDSYDSDGKSYFIILATDTYDIRPRDGEGEWSEESEEQFTYFVCSICKVKDPKAALRYAKGPKEFRGASTGSVLDTVMHGFMFPAFTDYQAVGSAATFYTKKVGDIQEDFIRSLFATENDDMPSPALTRKEKLDKALDVVGDQYTLEAAASITQLALDRMEEESDTNPDISFDEIGEAMMGAAGISFDLVERFVETGTDLMGGSVSAATIVPKNRMFVVETQEAEIRTTAENAGKLRRKKIDGRWCLIIPIEPDQSVTVNGRKIYMGDVEAEEG